MQYILNQMLKLLKKLVSFNIIIIKTDIIPTVLDGRSEIILSNWPRTKYVACNDNHEYPI